MKREEKKAQKIEEKKKEEELKKRMAELRAQVGSHKLYSRVSFTIHSSGRVNSILSRVEIKRFIVWLEVLYFIFICWVM